MKRKTKPATLALLFLMIMLGPMNRIALAQQRGPAIDILRIRTVKSPDARLFEILTGNIDSWTTAVRPQNKRCPTFAYDGTIPPKYIEIMDDAGLTIMATEGFNVAYFVLNIRPDQTYRGRPDVGPFLGDVDFRHALFHLYNRDEIIPALYKYTVQSTESLVPPAQGGWHNPAVPSHPYDPDEARAILEDAGYHYDPGINNWRNSLGYAVPEISVLTPTYEAAATEAAHGARFGVVECLYDASAISQNRFLV
ncbi:MAG: ABC transporter substrate-binding protein, partial [Promethearchaeota archaeon]